MNTSQLIALLLPVLVQVTPQLVTDVANLIHGNPQSQGETDAAYIARIDAMIDANLAKASAEDKAIES